MRSFIEKTAECLGVFSPIIILIFVCSAYLYKPADENNKYYPVPKQTLNQKPVNHFLNA